MKRLWNEQSQYRRHMVVSSVVVLLPALLGIIFWKELPEWMPIRWDASGNPDGYALRWIAVFVMPMVLLAVHWLCLFLTLRDPGNRQQNKKALGLVFWLMPLLSLVMGGLMYTLAMDHPFRMEQINVLVFGLLFVVMGNYLPKIRQNSTLGIRLPWTLRSEENWNKTHRFASRFWIAAGAAMLVSVPMSEKVMVPVMLAGLLLAAVVPTVYSYWYFKKYESA